MATIKDIAKASGVSPSTVSIILNGKSEERKISEKTCQKVWEAVRALGYQPNVAARTLRDHGKNTPPIIALYWANDFRTTMLSRFLKGLEQVRSHTQFPYEIAVFPYENNTLKDQSALLTGRRFHAAIIANASEADMEFIKNTSLAVPIVLYNRELAHTYSVTVDNYHMGVQAAKALLEKSKKKPWILTSASSFPGMELRIQGFTDTFKEANIEIPTAHTLITVGTTKDGAAKTAQILAAGECDCIFCLSDAIAFGCLFALHQAHISVPDQVSVMSIGNGDDENACFSIPPLSTVYLPMEDMAASCLEILLKHLNHQPVPSKNIVLSTPVHLRES